MNWGWKIVFLYSAFIIMTLSMVFYFMSQDVELVADDYYKQEIEYQDQIDKISNTKALNKPIGYEYSSRQHTVKLSFPEVYLHNTLNGKIHFYRPSNSSEDKIFDLKVNDSCEQVISIASLSRGLWKIKINWNSGGKEFYDEKVVTF